MQMFATSLLLFGLLGLAACGGKHGVDTGKHAENAGSASLPKPEATKGSVTGMPDRPGPGHVGPPDPDAAALEAPLSGEGELVPPSPDGSALPDSTMPPLPGNPDGVADTLPLPAAEPTPQDAVAVVRDYYDAIDTRDFARAYALWSDAGGASGKTLQQFATGFADTADVSVQLDPPGRIDAAAGSRYVEVPVTIAATQRDGSVRRYAGTYTLRRAVVDGASAEQRAWRIVSAQLRENSP